MPHRDYSVSVGSDADTETDGIMSPEHAVRLWGRSNTKSGRSSCLSSRANSNLTLTDTEHENTENGRALFSFTILDLILHCLFLFGFDFGVEMEKICVVCFFNPCSKTKKTSFVFETTKNTSKAVLHGYVGLDLFSFSDNIQMESMQPQDELHIFCLCGYILKLISAEIKS